MKHIIATVCGGCSLEFDDKKVRKDKYLKAEWEGVRKIYTDFFCLECAADVRRRFFGDDVIEEEKITITNGKT